MAKETTYYTKSFSVSKVNEKDIYEHLIKVEKKRKITDYIKELILKDIRGEFTEAGVSEDYIKQLVDKLVEEKLSTLDIKKNSDETATTGSDFSENDTDDSSKDKHEIEKEESIDLYEKEEENNSEDQLNDTGDSDKDKQDIEKENVVVKKKKKYIPKVAGVMG